MSVLAASNADIESILKARILRVITSARSSHSCGPAASRLLVAPDPVFDLEPDLLKLPDSPYLSDNS
jgi:hypothetical protein